MQQTFKKNYLFLLTALMCTTAFGSSKKRSNLHTLSGLPVTVALRAIEPIDTEAQSTHHIFYDQKNKIQSRKENVAHTKAAQKKLRTFKKEQNEKLNKN